MNDLQIDPEFKALIPPLSDEERAQLEQNIRTDGCRDPIVTWRGFIIDGHNRFEICTQNGWRFRTVEQLLSTRDDAKIWIIRNQFGRRNLTPGQRIALATELEPLEAAKARARQGTRTDLGKNLPANLPESSSERETRAAVAKVAGVSPRTYDKGKAVLEKAPPELKDRFLRGETSVDAAYQDIRGQERRAERVERIQEVTSKNTDLDTSKPVPVLYADPPWRYEHVKTDNRAIENQYPTMSLEEICALPVSDAATPDAVLFLWATSPKLAESFEVLKAWGFTYRTCMVWVKDKIGMGYYARQRHELLLIATRGDLPVPEASNRPDSVVEAERGKHSEKPDVFYELIERMYPEFEKRELFLRGEARPGWTGWGNQAA